MSITGAIIMNGNGHGKSIQYTVMGLKPEPSATAVIEFVFPRLDRFADRLSAETVKKKRAVINDAEYETMRKEDAPTSDELTKLTKVSQKLQEAGFISTPLSSELATTLPDSGWNDAGHGTYRLEVKIPEGKTHHSAETEIGGIIEAMGTPKKALSGHAR